MRAFLFTVLSLWAAFGLAAGPAKMPDVSKMNVLFIDIEDTNAAALGCYGNPICKTPNLDRLVATGVRFDAAYCQAVCCNPTRTSFLTGLRPTTTGVITNGDVMNQFISPDVVTLPAMLKAKGFYLADVGKLYHTMEYAPDQYRIFDRLEMIPPPPGWKGPPPILKFPPVPKERAGTPAPKEKTGREFQEWRAKQSDRYGDSGKLREEEHDYRAAATACALLKDFAASKRQFFLSVTQSRPHTPLICPKKYIDMYDPAKIPDPPAPIERCKGFPYPKRAVGGNPDIFMKAQPTKQQAREAIAAYYACLTFVDENVGMMLDTLEREGLAQNTIVIFLGDHGFHLGDHGCWSKYSMMRETNRVALIMRVPGAPANGKPCRQIVEFIDLMPTLGDLFHADVPKNVEGISFAPLLVQPDRPWKKATFMAQREPAATGEMVRSAKFSYLEFTAGPVPVALYDLEKDPWEMNNVADDPNYAAARREMAALLKAGWKAALPPAE